MNIDDLKTLIIGFIIVASMVAFSLITAFWLYIFLVRRVRICGIMEII